MTITAATSDADHAAGFRLRYQAVMHQGWGTPEDYPDGLEHDGYDDHRSIQVLAVHDHRPVATCRLVLPAPDRPLPMEEAFGIQVEPRGAVAELGRMVVVPSAYREHGNRIFGGMLARTWLEARAHGCDLYGGVLSPGMRRRYERLGIHLRILAPPMPYWGEERVPALFDVAASMRGRLGRARKGNPGGAGGVQPD